jgi:dihydroorotase-like cyclic amidohydrolase
LPEPPESWVDVDVDVSWELANSGLQTRVGWTPFAGRRVYGRVEQVVLRGRVVYAQGQILAEPGSGRVLFGEP